VQDLLRHAEILGLELPLDNDLLWLAEKSLNAPLPENWQQGVDERGLFVYYNYATGARLSERPQNIIYRSAAREYRRKKEIEARLGARIDENNVGNS
jgi:hypothetical protein